VTEVVAGFVIERHEMVGSTSLLARERIAGGAAPTGPTALVAATQCGGVGRLGRRWVSPAGGLWFTAVWPLPAGSNLPPSLGLRLGVACLRAVGAICARAGAGSASLHLKWPNDVLVNRGKVLGVLTETVLEPGTNRRWVLAGVGLNANFSGARFGAELADRGVPATTLRDELGRDVDLRAALALLLAEAREELAAPGLRVGTLGQARAGLWGLGRPATVATRQGAVRGLLRGLSDAGEPVLDVPGAGPVECAGAGGVVIEPPGPASR